MARCGVLAGVGLLELIGFKRAIPLSSNKHRFFITACEGCGKKRDSGSKLCDDHAVIAALKVRDDATIENSAIFIGKMI
jgi:hypothetical protein